MFFKFDFLYFWVKFCKIDFFQVSSLIFELVGLFLICFKSKSKVLGLIFQIVIVFYSSLKSNVSSVRSHFSSCGFY
jgi:hypothetical protein